MDLDDRDAARAQRAAAPRGDGARGRRGRRRADAKARLIAECAALAANKHWQDLHACAEKLLALGAATEGNRYIATAKREQFAEIALADLENALANGDENRAAKVFAKIPEDSIYAAEARKRIESILRTSKATLAADEIEAMAEKARPQLLGRNTAGFHGKLVATIDVAPTGPITEAEVTGGETSLQTCVRDVLLGQRLRPTHAGGKFRFAITLDGSSPGNPCADVDDWISQSANQYAAGFPKAALALMTRALQCKTDVRMLRLAATYACRAHDKQAAKQYYDKVPARYQAAIAQVCVQEGIDLEH